MKRSVPQEGGRWSLPVFILHLMAGRYLSVTALLVVTGLWVAPFVGLVLAAVFGEKHAALAGYTAVLLFCTALLMCVPMWAVSGIAHFFQLPVPAFEVFR